MLTKIIDNMHNMGLYLAYKFSLHIPTTIILDMVRGMQGLLSICYSKAYLLEVGSITICGQPHSSRLRSISPVLQQPPDQRGLKMVGNP